jgi:hypothetical protein
MVYLCLPAICYQFYSLDGTNNCATASTGAVTSASMDAKGATKGAAKGVAKGAANGESPTCTSSDTFFDEVSHSPNHVSHERA